MVPLDRPALGARHGLPLRRVFDPLGYLRALRELLDRLVEGRDVRLDVNGQHAVEGNVGRYPDGARPEESSRVTRGAAPELWLTRAHGVVVDAYDLAGEVAKPRAAGVVYLSHLPEASAPRTPQSTQSGRAGSLKLSFGCWHSGGMRHSKTHESSASE